MGKAIPRRYHFSQGLKDETVQPQEEAEERTSPVERMACAKALREVKAGQVHRAD